LGLGCSRGALERVYGPGSYLRMHGYSNWLDKTEDEALKLLWSGDGPPCPSRSPCLPCRTSPATTDSVCGWVLWLSMRSTEAKDAEISRLSSYRTQRECDLALAQAVTEQSKLPNRTKPDLPGVVITWLGKRGESPSRSLWWSCLPDVMDPRGLDHR